MEPSSVALSTLPLDLMAPIISDDQIPPQPAPPAPRRPSGPPAPASWAPGYRPAQPPPRLPVYRVDPQQIQYTNGRVRVDDRELRARALTHSYALADRVLQRRTTTTSLGTSAPSPTLMPLKELCVRALLSPFIAFPSEYMTYLPSHIRALIARHAAIEQPLLLNEVEAVWSGEGSIDGEVVLVGYEAALSSSRGLTKTDAKQLVLSSMGGPRSDGVSKPTSWDDNEGEGDDLLNDTPYFRAGPSNSSMPLTSLILYGLAIPLPDTLLPQLPATLLHLSLLALQPSSITSAGAVTIASASLSRQQLRILSSTLR